MSQIGVSYTPSGGSPVYSFTFKESLGAEVPRTYAASVSFEFAVSGSAVTTGPSQRQRYIWAISSPMTNAEAIQLDEMFRAWDQDRATGLPAAVGIIDQTFGDPVDTSAVFSTPPSYSKFGPNHKLVSFGLTEV